MIVQLDTHRLQTLGQVREFLDGSQEIDLRPQTRTEAYAFVAETVQRFDYAGRSKADKGLLRRFLTKATDLSRAQVTRLLRQYRTTGEVIDRRGAPRQPFPRRYTPHRHRAARRTRRAPRHALRPDHPQALRPRLPPLR